MNKEKLFSLMPKEMVKKDEVIDKILEQKGIVEAGNRYASSMSINRYLHKKLSDFDIHERLDLFLELTFADFIINENQLYFNDLDIEGFSVIVKEAFELDSMYELDNFYIERLLNGQDIMQTEVEPFDEKVRFDEVLNRFVFQTSGMPMGDTPTLMTMLVVKKALLGSYLAEQNIETLLKGHKEIYDISILM